MTMSKVKSKNAGSTSVSDKAGKTTPTRNNKIRKKEKFKKKGKFVKKNPSTKDEGRPKFSLPPTDAQQISANWKALLGVLKASPPEKSQTIKTPAPQQKKLNPHKVVVQDEALGKDISVKGDGPTQTDAGKAGKKKPVQDKVVAKGSQENGKDQTATEPNSKASAKKGKRERGKADGEQTAKKKKKVEKEVEDRKPTEADLWFDDVDPDEIEATMGKEAADIMRKKQGLTNSSQDPESLLVKQSSFDGLTRAVAMDCEMVGVGPDGEDSILARVSLVNLFGKCVYDKYVKPTETVTDYRTAVSGIRPEDIKDGEDLKTVQREVAEILQGRILVGHAIHNDLKILLLDHPKKKIRDTQKYKPFKEAAKSGRPALRVLCRKILNVKVQQGEHSSVQDAQATMRLYTLVKKQWEAEIKASQTSRDVDTKTVRRPKAPKLKK